MNRFLKITSFLITTTAFVGLQTSYAQSNEEEQKFENPSGEQEDPGQYVPPPDEHLNPQTGQPQYAPPAQYGEPGQPGQYGASQPQYTQPAPQYIAPVQPQYNQSVAPAPVGFTVPQEFTVPNYPPSQPPPGEIINITCMYEYQYPVSGHWAWNPAINNWSWRRAHCVTPKNGYVYSDPFWGINEYGYRIYRDGFFLPSDYYDYYYRAPIFAYGYRPLWYRPVYHPIYRPFAIGAYYYTDRPGIYYRHGYARPYYHSGYSGYHGGYVGGYHGGYSGGYHGPVYHNPGPIPPHIPHTPAPYYGTPRYGTPRYGTPAPHYGTPAPHYVPAPHYGSPAPHYGSPAPHYGSPAPHYGAPHGGYRR